MSHRRDLPKNPLIRDGVSQRQRQTPALSPTSIQVDERDLADFLVFVYRLSAQVNYYRAEEPIATPPNGSTSSGTSPNGSLPNGGVSSIPIATPPNSSLSNSSLSNGSPSNGSNSSPPNGSPAQVQPDGNWQAFFEGNTPVQIALISKTRPQTVKDSYIQALEAFLERRTCTTLLPVLNTWKVDILTTIQQWYTGLEPYTPLQPTIKGLVKTNLREPLTRMQSFERACGDVDTRFYASFTQSFGLTLDPTPSIDPTPLNGTLLQARTELDAVFQALFQTYRQIIQHAPKSLQASLTDRQDHQPYLSLYLAFLEVLQLARDDLNRITQRHLDFFYRQVLRLPDRPAQPDQAHLIFELAKLPQAYKLPAGTHFKAGKDASGVDLVYRLDEEVVIHKATIASLKGLFLDSEAIKTGEPPKHLLGLYASPIANSFDGKGATFPKDQAVNAWLPFGDNKRDHARVGFAIASDVLLLQEGRRVITLKLSLEEGFLLLPANKLDQVFAVYFSGEKDWIAATILPAGQPAADGIEQTGWNGSVLSLVVELAADVDPVLPYDPAAPIPYFPDVPNLPLHLDRPMPVVRLELNDDVLVNGRSPYHYFQDAELKDITIQTRVNEVRTLVIQNDLSVLDASKPFQPFGSQPKNGAFLYIGSQEVLEKHLTALTIDLELEELEPNWAVDYAAYGVNANFKPGTLTIQALRQKIWHSATTPARLFDSTISLTDQLAALHLDSFDAPEPIELWTPQSKTGFLRLQLVDDFLHDKYPTVLARQVLAAATNQIVLDEASNAKRQAVIGAYYRRNDGSIDSASTYYVDLDAEPLIPPEPYTPTIRSLSLSYTAQANQTDCRLFHLHPFGGFAQLPITGTRSLLPSFTHEGELFIGVQYLDPPTALPLLFQVAEETADTQLRRDERFKLQWSYLKDNTWESLDDRIVSDTTNGLITSGIIHLAIPEDISRKQTTILDPNLHWLKVSLLARSRTVCQIIGIHPQAARATFSDAGNDPNHLATPLPPGTIAKLALPQPEIKKVEQPYASFGGRTKEQPTHFYTRISEHLRHKGRAVTIFDYERLVLEKFPDIYKVRCINHGQFDDRFDRLYELVPGSITLAVIPDLSQRNTTNDLEPNVNVNRLQAIEHYLANRSSPWAAIRVVNPKYERIQVECQVKFRSPYAANFGYYRRELERAITGFLTPWTVDQSAEINFGGKVYRSSILNFIEEQYYVDYVVNFKMHHDTERHIREAIATTARSVLTSVSPTTSGQNHIIQEFKETPIPPNPKLETGVLGYESLDELVLGE
ncbi:MAG: hypothetical protein HC769_32405 [Cyanobacteria bacterium CRU_2_1]|nr:hypothetical protein [Cyanobacteria bacterium CRU_2_1]